MNFIGLDIGKVRTGVAISTDAKLASPLSIVSTKELARCMKSLLAKFGPSHLVVGLPRGLSGLDSRQVGYTRSLALEIAKNLKLRVTFMDEKLSTQEAKRLTVAKRVDDISAQIVLQAYLESRE